MEKATRPMALRALMLLALSAASGCLAQQFERGYDYEYGYNDFYNHDDGSDKTGGPDAAGHYNDDYELTHECQLDANNKPVLSDGTPSCDIKISGIDKLAIKQPGGFDGVYKLTSCHNGKAMYVRAKSPPGEDRVLWYSTQFGDWDISKGKEASNEAANEKDILLYGGEMERASLPLFVSNWHLAPALIPDTLSQAKYVPINIKVQCADGEKLPTKLFNRFQDLYSHILKWISSTSSSTASLRRRM